MTEMNGFEFERLIEFVELDLTAFGDSVYRFVNSSTFEADLPEDGNVTWKGHSWQPLPFTCQGFQRGGENLVRPSITVPDFGGALYVKFLTLRGAYGAPLTRYMALAADVESGNPYAAFVEEHYVVNSVGRGKLTVDVELATHVDFAKRKVPGVKMDRTRYPGLGSNLLRN